MADGRKNDVRRARITVEVDCGAVHSSGPDVVSWDAVFRVAGYQAYKALEAAGGRNIKVIGARPAPIEGEAYPEEVSPHPLTPCRHCGSVLWLDSCCFEALQENARTPRTPREAGTEARQPAQMVGAESLDRLREAAEGGDVYARIALGRLLMDGTLHDEGADAGASWFKLAAEQGHLGAAFTYGRWLVAASDAPDLLVEGLAWLKVASKYGNRFAQDPASRLEQELSIDQVLEAERRALFWIKDHPSFPIKRIPWEADGSVTFVAGD